MVNSSMIRELFFICYVNVCSRVAKEHTSVMDFTSHGSTLIYLILTMVVLYLRYIVSYCHLYFQHIVYI